MQQPETHDMKQPETFDVLVVGAGPAGLTTAASLARYGVRVLVVDKHAGTSTFPKATGIRLRSMEILRSWGLDAELQTAGPEVRLAMSVSATLADPRHQEVSLGLPSPEAGRAASPATFALCAQDRLEPVLRDHVRSHGGQVRFRTEMVGLAMTDHGVVARLRPAVTGDAPTGSSTTYQVNARYVVGADGGRSSVRTALGIDWRPLGFEGHHLAVLFRADLTEALHGRSYALYTITADGLAGRFVPTGAPDRWVYDREWHPERGEVLADWNAERIVNVVRGASGLPTLQPEILATFPWEFGAAVATRQQSGRAFLVGDAAHQTTPRGALGMNTGIADGHNLGWKLAWVIRGWADSRLLESYDAERRPVGQHNALRSLRPGADDSDDAMMLAQDIGVTYRSEVIDSEGAGHEGRNGQAVVGVRAPHAWVMRGGRRLSTLDLYDDRLTVVTGPHGRAWQPAVDELAAAGVPVQLVELGRDVSEDGTARQRYGVEDGGAVLVRPDGHVAWCRSSASPNATSLLREAFAVALGRSPGGAESVALAG